jgi:hypothetical protein
MPQSNPQPEPDYAHLLEQLRIRTAANRYAATQRRIIQQAQQQIIRKSTSEN